MLLKRMLKKILSKLFITLLAGILCAQTSTDIEWVTAGGNNTEGSYNYSTSLATLNMFLHKSSVTWFFVSLHFPQQKIILPIS